jgi:hypothetical protein
MKYKKSFSTVVKSKMFKLALLGTALATTEVSWFNQMKGLFKYQNESCSEYLSSDQEPCFRVCARGDLRMETLLDDSFKSIGVVLTWRFDKTADKYVPGEQKPGSYCDCSEGGNMMAAPDWVLIFRDYEKLFHSIIRNSTNNDMTIVYKLVPSKKKDKIATCSQLFQWQNSTEIVTPPSTNATATSTTKAYYKPDYRTYAADYVPPAYPTHTGESNAYDESKTAKKKPKYEGKVSGAESLVVSGFALLAAMFAL